LCQAGGPEYVPVTTREVAFKRMAVGKQKGWRAMNTKQTRSNGTWVVVVLCFLAAALCSCQEAPAQEEQARLQPLREQIEKLRLEVDNLERLVDALENTIEGEVPAEPIETVTVPAEPEVSEPTVKVPDSEVEWLTPYDWWTYGAMETSTVGDDPHVLVLDGSSRGGLGINKDPAITPDATNNVLVVRVLQLGQSQFDCHGRMLKVTIGAKEVPLRCATPEDISSGDPDFVLPRLGDYFYTIPPAFLSGPQKLVLAFWIAEVDLHLKVGLTTEEAMQQAIQASQQTEG